MPSKASRTICFLSGAKKSTLAVRVRWSRTKGLPIAMAATNAAGSFRIG